MSANQDYYAPLVVHAIPTQTPAVTGFEIEVREQGASTPLTSKIVGAYREDTRAGEAWWFSEPGYFQETVKGQTYEIRSRVLVAGATEENWSEWWTETAGDNTYGSFGYTVESLIGNSVCVAAVIELKNLPNDHGYTKIYGRTDQIQYAPADYSNAYVVSSIANNAGGTGRARVYFATDSDVNNFSAGDRVRLSTAPDESNTEEYTVRIADAAEGYLELKTNVTTESNDRAQLIESSAGSPSGMEDWEPDAIVQDEERLAFRWVGDRDIAVAVYIELFDRSGNKTDVTHIGTESIKVLNSAVDLDYIPPAGSQTDAELVA